MNQIILKVQGHLLYPDKYTKEQLEQNYIDAAANFTSAYTTYAEANKNDKGAAWACQNAADDASSAAYAAAYVNARVADDWLDEYFVNTGENRQDYIDAVNRGEL